MWWEFAARFCPSPVVQGRRIGQMLEHSRACACGGTVDVMTVAKLVADGRSLPTKIGACLRCGKWFNEAGLLELPHVSARLQSRKRATEPS